VTGSVVVLCFLLAAVLYPVAAWLLDW